MTRVEVLKARLLQDSIITSMTEGRIFNATAPARYTDSISGLNKPIEYPYIVFRQIGSSPSVVDADEVHDYSYSIECYARNITDADRIGKHVKYTLSQSRAMITTDIYTKIMAGIILGESVNNYDTEKISVYAVDVKITFKELLKWM